MKKYGKDYRQTGKKEFEYTGDWYASTLTREDFQKAAKFNMCELFGITLAYILGLFVNNAGSHMFYVLMPFVGLVFPIFYGWRGSASLRILGCPAKKGDTTPVIPEAHKAHFRRSQYEEAVKRPYRAGFGLVILSAAVLGGDIWLMITKYGEIAMIRELIFALCALGIFGAGLSFMRRAIEVSKTFRVV